MPHPNGLPLSHSHTHTLQLVHSPVLRIGQGRRQDRFRHLRVVRWDHFRSSDTAAPCPSPRTGSRPQNLHVRCQHGIHGSGPVLDRPTRRRDCHHSSRQRWINKESYSLHLYYMHKMNKKKCLAFDLPTSSSKKEPNGGRGGSRQPFWHLLYPVTKKNDGTLQKNVLSNRDLSADGRGRTRDLWLRRPTSFHWTTTATLIGQGPMTIGRGAVPDVFNGSPTHRPLFRGPRDASLRKGLFRFFFWHASSSRFSTRSFLPSTEPQMLALEKRSLYSLPEINENVDKEKASVNVFILFV